MIKGNLKRIVTVFFVVGVCAPMLLSVLYVAGGLLVIANEERLSIKELNNTFINADYKDWHTVELCNEKAIMLPDKWNIKTIESITVITDENGMDVAKGGILGTDGDSSYRYEQLLRNLLGHPVSVVTMSRTESVQASRYGTIILSDDLSREYHYIFLSSSGANDMFFCLI